uniref:poly(A)-specific ribonuclease n=1 Tax=Wollemia nobilis TaxID=56998 RepID=A0A0C9RSP5_9CONI
MKDSNVCIREVWADNLDDEFELIREIVDEYPFVAMDTEFPGVAVRLTDGATFKSRAEYHYQTLKANVDTLNLIQVGLTFSDEKGNLPECGTGKRCVWQFNFKEFDPAGDMYAPDSIELLKQSGIDFEKNNAKGIHSQRFAELLMSSGLVLNENVRWITFHSAYDFGYLLKLLTCQRLPSTRQGFLGLMRLYFPNVYDVKHLIKFCDGLYGGLNRVAELLKLERIGICHQAGSDSLLTSSVFMKLQQDFLRTSTEMCAGILYGL